MGLNEKDIDTRKGGGDGLLWLSPPLFSCGVVYKWLRVLSERREKVCRWRVVATGSAVQIKSMCG